MEVMAQTTFPEGKAPKANSLSIVELFGKERLEDIMRKIAAATGLAFVTVDYRGEGVTDSISFCPFCKKVQEDPEREKLCSASNAFGAIQAAVFRKTYIYFCPCGLLEVAIPFEVQGQYLGGFIGGQIHCIDAPTDVVHLNNVLHHTQDLTKTFEDDYKEVLDLPYEKFVHITELVSMIVNQMAEKELVNVIQQQYHDDQIALYAERERRIELEKGLNESRLVELRSQMNPYFLISTLTAISNIAAVENARQTNEVITMFARFYMDSMSRASSSELVTDEMKTIDRYLFIQKARLGEKLEYTINVAEDMQMQYIPSMLVFPFVERAVYYGIGCKKENGHITVTAEYDRNDVVIRVADDGPGLSGKELENAFGHRAEAFQQETVTKGIDIVRQRMEKYFGKEHDVKIEAEKGKGTVCTIRYPRSFDGRAE